MAHAAGVEGVQMAISFTVIEGCANLGTCLQVECMISLSLAVIYLLALTLNVSNIRPMVNIVRHYMLHYILCLSVKKIEYLSLCHFLWLGGVTTIAYRLF